MASTNGRSNSRWFTSAMVFGGVLMGAHFADVVRPQSALAQGDTLSPFNAAEQRKQTIEQLREVNQRLGRLEAQIRGGINVKVTEMPAAVKKSDE